MHKILADQGLDIRCVKSIASIDLKANEPGLVALAEKHGWPFEVYPAAELDQVEGIENPSETVKKYVGTRTVAEGACLLAAGARELTVAKRSYKEDHDKHNMTLAVARIPFAARER